MTTQWRASAFGYAGDPNARTPCLDALAAQSVNFFQAVTPHPFGPFARAAMLTGVRSPENGVRDYYDPLPVSARTVAHDFNARGYATAFFGKWHLARRDRQAALVGEPHAKSLVPPAERGGFSLWQGFESGFLLNDPWLHGSDLPEPRQFSGYQSDVVCEQSLAWLAREKKAKPWFCVVSLEAPHPPYDAPAAGLPPRDPASVALPTNVPRGGDVEIKARRELAGYYSHIEATDRAIGRLLRAASVADTVVIFTSVHGDMHGAHGLFRKGWPHEESVRVPLLWRAPGLTPRRDDSAISLVDLPRLLRRWSAGDFSTDAGGGFAQISMPSVVALPHQCDRTWRGVRSKTRKLVLNADNFPWLFFDLENDPGETANLVSDSARAWEIAQLRVQIAP